MAELCDDCGKQDRNGVPCALMFKKGTEIGNCSGHESDSKAHAKLVKKSSKQAGEGEVTNG